MMQKRFDVRLDPDAVKEYNKLDNSVVKIVNKAIDELEYRADEIGKKLSNYKSTKLIGCKEIKLRDAGIRIIFKVTNETVEVLRVVYVYTIEKRSDDIVFKVANKRNETFKGLKKKELLEHLEKSEKWNK
jgi:mRNA interferase RelE/StbE